MGQYKFNESSLDARYWKNINKVVGNHRNGQVVFVDVDEAKLEVNKKRGLVKAGWWYVEKVYRNGEPQYRRELLCAASRATITDNPPRNTSESSEGEDDKLVVDGNYELYFSSTPINVSVWANEFNYVTDGTTGLLYNYKLLNYGETDKDGATSLSMIKDNGLSVSSSGVEYYIDFQEKSVPKKGGRGSKNWKTFVPSTPSNDYDPTFSRGIVLYGPNVKVIFDSHTIEERQKNNYYYRAVLSNNIGSAEVISDECQIVLEDFTFNYNLDDFENGFIQSGDLVSNTQLGYTFSVIENEFRAFDVSILQERSVDGNTWVNMFDNNPVVTGSRTATEDFVNSGTFNFTLPSFATYFKVANNGMYYRLALDSNNDPEVFIKEERQLVVKKREGYFSIDLPDSIDVTPTLTDSTQWQVFTIDVKNSVNRDESIGGTNADYALVTNWQYRADSDTNTWTDFPANRTLGTNSNATTAVGTDITKAAVVFDRATGYQVRVSCQAGTDLAETEPVFSKIMTVNIDHLIDIGTQPAADATIATSRGAVTSVSASVAFGTLTYQWQLSTNDTDWVDISRTGTNSTTSTLSLSVSDVDAIVTGSPTSVYARVNISGGTYAPDITSDSIELTVTR